MYSLSASAPDKSTLVTNLVTTNSQSTNPVPTNVLETVCNVLLEELPEPDAQHSIGVSISGNPAVGEPDPDKPGSVGQRPYLRIEING